MSKNVDWSKTYKSPIGDIQRGGNNKNKFSSMREAFSKHQEQVIASEKAEKVLQKAFPVMKSILMQRMTGRHPIKVMIPLPYTTEVLGGEEEDDGFYSNSAKGADAKFQSITKTIPVGTELTFLNLEKSMNQLWFKTDKGEEIGIYVDEQNRLMTHTDIGALVAQVVTEE